MIPEAVEVLCCRGGRGVVMSSVGGGGGGVVSAASFPSSEAGGVHPVRGGSVMVAVVAMTGPEDGEEGPLAVVAGAGVGGGV